jgi:hypothetical protein
MSRREYEMQLIVNGVFCRRVLIDQHYETKHGDTISDELILELVKTLARRDQKYDRVKLPFYYFVNDHIEFNDKLYKLVWLMEEHMDYIGVVNAYRR